MKKQSLRRTIVAPFVLALLVACSTQTQRNPSAERKPTSITDIGGTIPLPILKPENGPALEAELRNTASVKKAIKTMDPDQADLAIAKLRDYLLFLNLSAEDMKVATTGNLESDAENADAVNTTASPTGAPEPTPIVTTGDEGGEEEADPVPSNVRAIKRLFQASTQFLYCDDFTDWDCLERKPNLKPFVDYRQEIKDDLGVSVYGGKSLDMEYFFTKAWDNWMGTKKLTADDEAVLFKNKISKNKNRVQLQLADKIRKYSSNGLSMAMFGIDDHTITMKEVWNAIQARAAEERAGKAAKVRAVVDVIGIEQGLPNPNPPLVEGENLPPLPWVFDYVASKVDPASWLFGKSTDEKNVNGLHTNFQYASTPKLLLDLNSDIQSNEDARVRIEWPNSNIMHNKYMVMENDKGEKAVWSGTANISRNCMGLERNANMAIFIRNTQIAQAFQDEFEHMYGYDSKAKPGKKVIPLAGNETIPAGRFHHNKEPVSHRLFHFDDKTKVRVHFAPTDDAEHRVILPMILSAKKGDVIRISMFGGTGYEIVRALQYASARGAEIRIVFDSMLAAGPTSWVRDPRLNLSMPNPYAGKLTPNVKPGKITVKISGWQGKNHHKVGTLTRKLPGGKWFAEQIIVGSQNWSSGGNDSNDENLVSIQNKSKQVPAAVAFNKEFETHLWKNSVPSRFR